MTLYDPNLTSSRGKHMTMKSKLTIPALTVALALVFTTWGPLGRKASALQNGYSNDSFRGTYVAQFTGDVFVPVPFDKFNGKFYRNLRFQTDGFGNLDVTTAVANYAGTVVREKFSGTYNVNPDGTFTISLVNLPVPFAPGVPNVFGFDGVFGDGGRIAKVALSSVSLGGQALPNIGSVISGEIVRQ
jgi:hypothetical protein